MARGAECAGATILSTIKNQIFFGFTPFHSVIEMSAFALITHPETAEGVNQCPITGAKRVKGVGGGVLYNTRGCLVLYSVSYKAARLSTLLSRNPANHLQTPCRVVCTACAQPGSQDLDDFCLQALKRW